MAEEPSSYVYNALLNELKSIRGRLTKMEEQLTSVSISIRRRNHNRSYFLHKIKCLAVEKQSLLNYIKEMEKFAKVDAPELNK